MPPAAQTVASVPRPSSSSGSSAAARWPGPGPPAHHDAPTRGRYRQVDYSWNTAILPKNKPRLPDREK